MSGRVLLAAISLGVLGAPVGQASAQAAATCGDAKELLDRQLAHEAESAYQSILAVRPGESCAREGLIAALQARCASADNLRKSGVLEQAKSSYTKLLDTYPTLSCAVDGLTETEKELAKKGATSSAEKVSQNCAHGESLLRATQWDAAKEAFKEALKADPRAPCAVQGLLDAENGAARTSPLADFDKKYVKPAFNSLKVVAMAAGVMLGFAGFLLAIGALLERREALRRRLPAALRRKLCVDLGVIEPGALKSKIDEDACKGLGMQLESSFLQLRQIVLVKQPHVIEGAVDPVSLPPLTALPDEANQVWQFLTKLYPQRRLTLSGALRYDEERGAGIMVKLIYEPTKEIWGARTIWQKEVNPKFKEALPVSRARPPAGRNPPADQGQVGAAAEESKSPDFNDYASLCMAVAAWAWWTIHDKEEHGGQGCAQERCNSMRNAYGTDSWRSFVYVQEGRRLHEAEKRAGMTGPWTAEDLFRRALDMDARNWQALLNLADSMLWGVLKSEVRRTQPGSYDQILDSYEFVKKCSPQVVSTGLFEETVSPTQVSTCFKIGETLMYRYILAGKEDGDIDKAERWLREASQKAAESSRYTARARDTVKAGHAVALRMAVGEEAARPLLEAFNGSKWLPAPIRYNLACYYSNSNGKKQPTEEEYNKAREYLREAFKQQEELLTSADVDPSLENLRQWFKKKDPQWGGFRAA